MMFLAAGGVTTRTSSRAPVGCFLASPLTRGKSGPPEGVCMPVIFLCAMVQRWSTLTRTVNCVSSIGPTRARNTSAPLCVSPVTGSHATLVVKTVREYLARRARLSEQASARNSPRTRS